PGRGRVLVVVQRPHHEVEADVRHGSELDDQDVLLRRGVAGPEALRKRVGQLIAGGGVQDTVRRGYSGLAGVLRTDRYGRARVVGRRTDAHVLVEHRGVQIHTGQDGIDAALRHAPSVLRLPRGWQRGAGGCQLRLDEAVYGVARRARPGLALGRAGH